MYAVIFKAKEARTGHGDNRIVTSEGQRMLLIIQPENWVPATSQNYYGTNRDMPADTKVFRSVKAAEKFMRSWKGHPWYAVPISWEIVKVRKVIERVTRGYRCLTS